MKKEIRVVDEAKGIVQITTCDERFYARRVNEGAAWDFVPSVTWIVTVGWPKGIGFQKWLASKGWDEALAIKEAAGDQGSKVHQAIAVLLEGGTVNMDDAFCNSDGKPEPLTPHEHYCVMTFCAWAEEEQPRVLGVEYTVWNERYRYAGTVDLKCRLKSDGYKNIWLVDCKTSSQLWPSHELQVSAYKRADGESDVQRLGILQVGYMRNKTKHFKFTRVADQFKLFLAARKIWEKEAGSQRPLQRDYPASITLGANCVASGK
jgi:hypothetical protein